MDSYDDGARASSSAPGPLRAGTKSPYQQHQQRFVGQKLAVSGLSYIPPTPMSAYFDAEDASVDYDENAMSTSSSPPTSSSTNGIRYEMGEASSPITPATPGTWKPRELTLLRSRIESVAPDGKDEERHSTLTPTLDGLGIRGLNAGQIPGNGDGRPVRSTGLRDILPIVPNGDTVHSRTLSNSIHPTTHTSAAPRELRLTGSLGPNYTHRFAGPASASAVDGTASRLNLTPPLPSYRTRSPTVGSSPLGLTTASRLPVRHGPAFPTSVVDRARVTAAAQTDGECFVTRQEDCAEVDAEAAYQGGVAQNDTVLSEIRPDAETNLPFLVEEHDGAAAGEQKCGEAGGQQDVEEIFETLTSTSPSFNALGLRQRNDSITSMETSIIESCAAGSRKKKPPAPLVLMPSPSSTYSKASLEASMPNSALSLPPTSSPAGFEFVKASVSRPAEQAQVATQDIQDFLTHDTATSGRNAAALLTGNHDAFLTPLQSPAGANAASWIPSREAISAGDLLNRLGTLDLSSPAVEDSSEQSGKTQNDSASKLSHSENRHTVSSSTSSANAFEYDSVTEDKRHAALVNSVDSHGTSSKHTSSVSSQSRKAASPSPMMAFNTQIFQPSSTRPRSRSADELTSFGAVRHMSGTAYMHGQDRSGDPKDGVNNDHQAQHSTVDVSWNSSTSPVSASTSQSTDMTSVGSRSRNSQGFGQRTSTGAASSISRRSISAGKINSGVEGGRRRSSQIRSAKPCAEVPDVPSFGYMGTNVTPSAPFRSLQVSPTTTVIPPQGLPDAGGYTPPTVREEIQGSSHWSSGSEDEEDYRGSFKSGRKSSSRSRKGSQVASSTSLSSSRRNTGPSSSQHSLAPLKKSNLFAGLGLRKKSVPNLLSDASSNASSPMPLPSDSPIMGRADGMREFPFPNQVQSKLSLSVTNLRNGTSSSANSAAPSPLSSPIIRMDQTFKDTSGETTVRGPSSRFLKRQVSTPTLAERFTNTLFGNGDNVPPVPRLRGDSIIGRGRDSKTFTHSRAPSTVTSPSTTPRTAFAPLTSSTKVHDEDGLYSMGKMLAQGSATPSQSSPSTQADVHLAPPAKSARRVRRTAPRARPHYTSLTDFGREWQAEHPDESFMGALGPALLEMALQASSGGRVAERETLISGESSSGTDNYGTGNSDGSNVALPAAHHASFGVNRGRGGDEERSDDYDRFKRCIVNECGHALQSDDSESDGEYCAEENDLPTLKASKAGSDDAPIGSTLRDPKQIMQKLQRSGTLPVQSRRARQAAQAAEVACAQQMFSAIDASELSNRLQGLQRASTLSTATRASVKATSTALPSSLVQPPAAQQSDDQFVFPPSKDSALSAQEYNKLHKPLPIPKEASTTSSLARSDPDSIVSDFAQRVRKRSQSRSRMRPVAMEHSSSAPVPAVPVCNTLAQAIARSQSQPKTPVLPSVSTTADSIASPPFGVQELRTSPTQYSDGIVPQPAMARVRPTAQADSLVEHRVYLSSMQRHQVISVKRLACSRELITALSDVNALPVDASVGDWSIFDVRTELGIERPLREYECLADVLSARNVINARRGALLLKRSDMAPYLSAQAVPKSAPALAGWMYVLDGGRKPSWNKRWCELRDGVLFGAKSERGRDEVQICDLKSFDAYTPVDGECAWASRAPKKNAFALCNVTNSPAVHDVNVYYFCMSDPRAARHWVTAINRARTFILRNETPGMFAAVRSSSRVHTISNAPAPTTSFDTPSMVSTANSSVPMTRGNQSAPASSSQAPLVRLTSKTFEKGSLLETAQHRGAQQPLGRVHVNSGHRKPVPE